MITIYKANDQVVKLPRLRSGLDETQFKNNATVSGTLYDKAGAAVAGFTDIEFVYQDNSDGDYCGQISEDCDPPAKKGYKLVITAVDMNDNFKATYDVEVVVRTS